MTQTLKIKTVTVHHGEDGHTIAEVDLIDDLGGGITRRLETFTVELDGTFQDGRDMAGIVAAADAKLVSAGVLQ